MKYQSPLIKATLVKRYKRFLADVTFANDTIATAHCANPGAMLGLKEEGQAVWLSTSDNPKRKLKYSWELTEIDGKLVGINTSLPNKIVEEAISENSISELAGYQSMRREVKYGINSRIDLLLEDEAKPSCYVEIKNVHMLRNKGQYEFPDSVTARGTKHLHELIGMVREGHRAVMLYLIQRMDGESLSFALDIDPAYVGALRQAKAAGVELMAYDCDITTTHIKVRSAVPVRVD